MNKILTLFICCSISLFASLKDDNVIHTTNCENNDIEACLQLGENGIYVHQIVHHMLTNGMIDESNLTDTVKAERNIQRGLTLQKEIVDPLIKACERANTRACVLLTDLYTNNNTGIATDINKSIKYSNLACAFGNGDGCGMLAVAYMQRDKHLPYTDDLILGNFEKSCDRKSIKGCLFAGRIAFDDPSSDDKNKFKAVGFWRNACIGKDMEGDEETKRDSCTAYGHLLYVGEYVKKDEATGLKLLIDSCKNGSGIGCLNVADIYSDLSYRPANNKNDLLKKAAKYYGEACNLQEKEGCRLDNLITLRLSQPTTKSKK